MHRNALFPAVGLLTAAVGCGFLVTGCGSPKPATQSDVASGSPAADAAAAKEKQALESGVQAVVYGLPLVIMDITMKKATNVTRPGTFNAPVNQFAHVREFPTAAF